MKGLAIENNKYDFFHKTKFCPLTRDHKTSNLHTTKIIFRYDVTVTVAIEQ